jgi:5'-nucleotidase
MRILVSNDDGVHAEGLKVLARELEQLGDVWVVAPLQEKSTTGHSLTLHKPLRMHSMGPRTYGVSGSPADCIYMGIKQVIKGMPDLVISGINRGANLGQDVYYSGTVSAAREACILGIRSLAVSLATDFDNPRADSELNYLSAAKLAVKVLKKMSSFDVPKHSLLNLNVPDLPLKSIKGVVLARQGFRYYSGNIVKRTDHRGRDYYWVGGKYKGFLKESGTDCHAVETKYASLTPLRLDSTDSRYLQALQEQTEKDLFLK